MKMDELKPKNIEIGDTSLEEIKIKGFVEIINGDTKIKANNKLVQSMLAWYANVTSVNYTWDSNWYLGTYNWKMYLGSDTTHPTLYNTPALTSQIGGAPTTTSGAATSPSNGVFNIVFTATWQQGSISGTVGEMALYLSVRNALQSFGWNISSGTTNIYETTQLVSRLSVADSSFSAFTINTLNPLTINWTIQYTF